MNNEFKQRTIERSDDPNYSNKTICCKTSKEDNIDSEMLFSSQTSNLYSSMRKKFSSESNPMQKDREKNDEFSIRKNKKFRKPLITIPKFASISKLEFIQFSLPRDYRALKLEARRESIVYSNFDTSATIDKSVVYLDNADKLDDDFTEQKLKRHNMRYSGLKNTKCEGRTYGEYDSLSRQITPQDDSNMREIDPGDKKVNMTSEDIFDIDDKEFVTRIDINHFAGPKPVLPVVNNDSSSSTLKDACSNHDILSQESTIIMNNTSERNIGEIKVNQTYDDKNLPVSL